MASIRDRKDLEPTEDEVRAHERPDGRTSRRDAMREKIIGALDSFAAMDAFNPYTPRERALVAILQAMFHGGIV